jgi:hypothetical protein
LEQQTILNFRRISSACNRDPTFFPKIAVVQRLAVVSTGVKVQRRFTILGLRETAVIALVVALYTSTVDTVHRWLPRRHCPSAAHCLPIPSVADQSSLEVVLLNEFF